MIFRLLVTADAACDETEIARVANELQLFFSIELSSSRVDLGPEATQRLLISPEIIRASLGAQDLLREETGLRRIALTSRQLTGNPQRSIFFDAACPIISNYYRSEDGSGNTLWFARKILHTGMAEVMGSQCTEETCVCGSAEDFICLCDGCEARLRARHFRDGLIHLKNAINWLNQRYDSPNPDFAKIPATRSQARLALAEFYAEERQAQGKQPFKRKLVLMVLHFLSDLVPFVKAVAKLGAEYKDMILIAKPYPYSRRDHVSHELEVLGVRVFRASQQEGVSQVARDVLSQLKLDTARQSQRVLIIEDGGYFGPLLHGADYISLLERCDGIVEQTARGIWNYDNIKPIQVPILNVAESDFKAEYEAPEIGRVTVQNIGRFVPNVKLSGRSALLLGFGSIGEQVVSHLNRAFNIGVLVVDNKELPYLRAKHRRDIVSNAYPEFSKVPDVLLENVRLVVGTTGRTSVTKDVMEKLPDGCILASTSSDQKEIDLKALTDLAGTDIKVIEEGNTEYSFVVEGRRKTLTVLAEGYPINFYAAESLPNDSIDPIMTFLLLCGIELCEKKHEPGIRPQEVILNVQKENRLIAKFLERC